jgi:hypothetical protein
MNPELHVCGRCPGKAGYPGRPFASFEDLRAHMLEIHGKEPEERPAPDLSSIDMRFVV